MLPLRDTIPVYGLIAGSQDLAACSRFDRQAAYFTLTVRWP